jgi:hypothetical protein
MNASEADAIRKYALLAQQDVERAHLIPLVLVFNAYGHWHQLVTDLLAPSDNSPALRSAQSTKTMSSTHNNGALTLLPLLPALQHGNALILLHAAQSLRALVS